MRQFFLKAPKDQFLPQSHTPTQKNTLLPPTHLPFCVEGLTNDFRQTNDFHMHAHTHTSTPFVRVNPQHQSAGDIWGKKFPSKTRNLRPDGHMFTVRRRVGSKEQPVANKISAETLSPNGSRVSTSGRTEREEFTLTPRDLCAAQT